MNITRLLQHFVSYDKKIPLSIMFSTMLALIYLADVKSLPISSSKILYPGRFQVQFRRDPLGVLEATTLVSKFCTCRGSVHDESKVVVRKNKAKPEEVEVQLNQYRIDGFLKTRDLMERKPYVKPLSSRANIHL